ncbi:hypothetical protein ACRAKI_12300 [Saccharothrix isguenensis]
MTSRVASRPSRPAPPGRSDHRRPTSVPKLPQDVAQAIWWELRAARQAVHSRHGAPPCDTELYVTGLRLGRRSRTAPPASGYRLSGTCPCRDLVSDAVELALRYLTDHAGDLHNPPGAVRRHLRFRLSDEMRRARAERGALSRPEAAAVNRYGKALPDDFHRTVLVILADEAGCDGPLRGESGLLRRLGDRCADQLGGTPDDYRHRLPDAIRLVERTCRGGSLVDVGGDDRREMVSWWEAHIDRPLGRRANPADLRVAASATDAPAIQIPDHDSAESPDEAVLDALLIAVATADRDDEEAALRETIEELARSGVLPPVRAGLLLNDPGRRLDVLDQVRSMLAPPARRRRRG